MAAIASKMAKIEEASRIRSEQTNTFISSTKEALDAKMETHEEKREAYINELRARLKDHLEGVEKTRYVEADVSELLDELPNENWQKPNQAFQDSVLPGQNVYGTSGNHSWIITWVFYAIIYPWTLENHCDGLF